MADDDRSNADAVLVASIVKTEPPFDPSAIVKAEKLFDPSAAPPFTLLELRTAIPDHCFKRNTLRSLSYFFGDSALIASLMFIAARLDRHTQLHWPLYWFLQGTVLWSYFVLGHESGHGAISDIKFLNHFVGHIVHTFVLVPYHGWRIGHRTHHQNHGHAEKDESWHPVREKHYKKMLPFQKLLRFSPVALLVFPLYLWIGAPGRYPRSHYHPDSTLFKKVERKDVITSTTLWVCFVAVLLSLGFVYGHTWIFKLYYMPYLVQVCWADLVVYLQHHGYKEKVPWYRGKEWSFIRGALSTIDRDFGIFNPFMHGAHVHVAHHLFPTIPHYHLAEATKALKPILGDYYREPTKSGLFPFHLVEQMLKSLREDHYVDDEGDVIFYKSEESLFTTPYVTYKVVGKMPVM